MRMNSKSDVISERHIHTLHLTFFIHNFTGLYTCVYNVNTYLMFRKCFVNKAGKNYDAESMH